MAVKISEFIGYLVGSYLSEKPLALTFFAGHFEIALVWALMLTIKRNII